jgi:N-dimethylarginine dimethylaminohydrolase
MIRDHLNTNATPAGNKACQVLMCRPLYFDVCYEINAFMEGNCGLANVELARSQWEKLFEVVQRTGASVELIEPQPGLPDFVFTANGGLVWNESVLLPHFAHPERQGEELHFRNWFQDHGFSLHAVPKGDFFEGEGDVVLRNEFIFMGTHARTSPRTSKTLEELTGLEVVNLRLNPKGYYHLDTCMFTNGPSGDLFFCPEAFTYEDRQTIVDRVGESKCVRVSLDEAKYFACNTVILGDTAISPTCPPSFVEKVAARGLRSETVDLSQFMKAGGAAKCLVLHLKRPS